MNLPLSLLLAAMVVSSAALSDDSRDDHDRGRDRDAHSSASAPSDPAMVDAGLLAEIDAIVGYCGDDRGLRKSAAVGASDAELAAARDSADYRQTLRLMNSLLGDIRAADRSEACDDLLSAFQ